MKTIWILNHYAGLGQGRHYKFAENLVKRGYNVKLFAASTIHNSDKNRITDSTKYILEEMEGVPCIYIKASNYMGNGRARIKNMLDYAIGLMSVTKKFDDEKPDVIYASSVHPLTSTPSPIFIQFTRNLIFPSENISRMLFTSLSG